MADEEEQTVERGEFSETSEKASEESVSDDDLESIASTLTNDDFSASSFEVHDMPTPTLTVDTGGFVGDSSAFRQGESLEESAGVASASPESSNVRKEQEQQVYRVKDETEISYAKLYEQRRNSGLREEDFRERRSSNFLTQQRVDLGDFDQRKNIMSGPVSEDYKLLDVNTGSQTRRNLPFEKDNREDYSPLKKLKK
jgi:hypothetical protein